jgi:tungstate transport system ATP-binding protein
MTSGAVAELIDVRKRRGPAFALEVPRLNVERGEILCVLGPTGAGKSTLLSLLAAAAKADAGTVRLNGQALGGDSLPIELRRTVTMTFQRPLMLSGSVRRNVEYGLHLRRGAVDDRVDETLERLGLAGLAARNASTLSGGETQLVSLARALVLRPALLLLDEPTASLDAARVALVEGVIRSAVVENGMAVVWTTHNLFQARRMADRIALLLDGRLIEVSKTDKFFHRPDDPRTAAFVEGRLIY